MAPAVNRRPPGQHTRPALIIFITTRLAPLSSWESQRLAARTARSLARGIGPGGPWSLAGDLPDPVVRGVAVTGVGDEQVRPVRSHPAGLAWFGAGGRAAVTG